MILFHVVILGSTAIYCGLLIYTHAQNILSQALYLGNPSLFNTTRDDCVWRHDRDPCPSDDIKIILYTTDGVDKKSAKLKLDMEESDWLRISQWNATKENIILVHGYAGGDDTVPNDVLRDAYIRHGGYNVFVVDWGVLCTPPCYVAAVHNTKPVAQCIARYFVFLRNSGLDPKKTTCVGHSLGAHICGLMSGHLNFRMERIIALDPARPLIRPGNQNRLDMTDARAVQVLHTNAGYYGEGGRVGHIDFCVNGGRRQPYCGNTTNVNLCSHIWSICYLAKSIFEGERLIAEPCNRRCPSNVNLSPTRRQGKSHRYGYAINYGIPMGQKTPIHASGSFCLRDTTPPFCPEDDTIGDPRCCLPSPLWTENNEVE